MGADEFISKCKSIIASYSQSSLDPTDKAKIELSDIYVVWLTKVLQNNKALLSTNLPDGMYYEITYNGDKKEFYMDAYKRSENRVFKFEEEK